MKTYKEFNEAAALAIPAASKLAIPALGGILKGVKAITNRETGLSDSEKRRVGELMDMIRRKKQREKTQKTEKDILDYGRKKEGIASRPVDEQMVAPKKPGKRDLLDLRTPTEKELDLRHLGSRLDRYTRTGRVIKSLSGGL